MKFEDCVGTDKTFKFYGIDVNCFKIDDTVFEVMEDPSDGYRSYFDCVNHVPSWDPIFFKRWICDVSIIRYEDVNSEGYKLIDRDGWVWLRFGTDNTDDWYPYFVFEYNPEKPLQDYRKLKLNDILNES